MAETLRPYARTSARFSRGVSFLACDWVSADEKVAYEEELKTVREELVGVERDLDTGKNELSQRRNRLRLQGRGQQPFREDDFAKAPRWEER